MHAYVSLLALCTCSYMCLERVPVWVEIPGQFHPMKHMTGETNQIASMTGADCPIPSPLIDYHPIIHCTLYLISFPSYIIYQFISIYIYIRI